ncbi:hypothetical protein [Acinetobacter larvae]|uniref:Uncharacterized protein n=1 Tax=Acinetobacter larvae TaxID=1789224 RepID=A0A1B2LWS3_9GAMM|nr:hypothetical protein [Acinetobacter larvae]AOA57385.1 hypothetical protein BFG52_02755 [Acinetobacter larvae]
MQKAILGFILAVSVAFSNSIRAEEVYFQYGDIAYAFELDSIEFYPSTQSKFKITAIRKLVGVPETKFYTGKFEEDTIAQYHMAFDCAHQSIQILDFMIGDKNNGAVKYKSDKKGEIIKAHAGHDLAMLNLVCENAKNIK